MKKVLIITYYWPPSGGAGVQRWVKFVKYLCEFGWEPVVYVPENPSYPIIDPGHAADIPEGVTIIKTTIWEPYSIYRKIVGKSGEAMQVGYVSDKTNNRKANLSLWLRGNLFIPDPRIFWVRKSIRFLSKKLETNPVDAIITTGPPHSLHLIGERLKNKFPNIPWVADFRDPWTQVFNFNDLRLSFLAEKIHQKMENKIVSSADAVIVVSEGMKKAFSNLSHKVIEVIPNGFDTPNSDALESEVRLEHKLTLSYTGMLTDRQNPEVLWRSLNELIEEGKIQPDEVAVNLTGTIHSAVIASINQYGLQEIVSVNPVVKHVDAIRIQQQSHLLLLCLVPAPNTGLIVTGKIFEYISAGRPIIGVGYVDGDAAAILKETGAGVMIDFEDKNRMKSMLLEFHKEYKAGSISYRANTVEIQKYHRRNLTSQLATLLDKVTENKNV